MSFSWEEHLQKLSENIPDGVTAHGAVPSLVDVLEHGGLSEEHQAIVAGVAAILLKDSVTDLNTQMEMNSSDVEH